jgi:hypothetical protein
MSGSRGAVYFYLTARTLKLRQGLRSQRLWEVARPVWRTAADPGHPLHGDRSRGPAHAAGGSSSPRMELRTRRNRREHH